MKKYVVLFALVVLIVLGSFIYKRYQDNKVQFVGGEAASTPTGTPEPTVPITLKEIKNHNKKSDCWVAIDRSVYNMTSFISIHPGGDEILKGCGTNASLLFGSEPRHNSAVREVLKTYKIGILVD